MKQQINDLKEYCQKSSHQAESIYRDLSETLLKRLKEDPVTQHAVMLGISDLLCACAYAAGLKRDDLVKSVDLSFTAFNGGNVMDRMAELKNDKELSEVVTAVFGELRSEVPDVI